LLINKNLYSESFLNQNKLIIKNIAPPTKTCPGYVHKLLTGIIIGNKVIAAAGGNENRIM